MIREIVNDNNLIINKYSTVSNSIKTKNGARERNSLSLLYIFIEKYINIDINELSSLVKRLLRDIEAVENSVCNDLINGFVKGTNSKLKIIKRTIYWRCSQKLLLAKLMLIPNR